MATIFLASIFILCVYAGGELTAHKTVWIIAQTAKFSKVQYYFPQKDNNIYTSMPWKFFEDAC